MCGIFFYRGIKVDNDNISKYANYTQGRGPEQSVMKKIEENNTKVTYMGFHRLRINDLSENGKQPFYSKDENSLLICNGEIYNHEYLKIKYDIECDGDSDCEVLIHLINKIGIMGTLNQLDGVFALVYYNTETEQLYMARDRIGVRPIFYQTNGTDIAIASEAKSLEFSDISRTRQLQNGYCFMMDCNGYKKVKYSDIPTYPTTEYNLNQQVIIKEVKNKLEAAIDKRLMSNREIGCLLSGGVDSSIIASVLSKKYKEKGKKVKTFSIGFAESTDLKYARKVSEYIDSEHHEIVMDYDEALSKIEEVIYATETYDVTTIRASVGMYMLSEYISKNMDETVIFSGEGADEIFGGYLYFHDAPDDDQFYNETLRLVDQLHRYDVLRADRCTAIHGLELRVPFLDKPFINYILSLPGHSKRPCADNNNFEKYILRKAFEDILPTDVAWRRKEGFSDGVGGIQKPWFEYIKEYVDTKVSDEEYNSTPNKDKYMGGKEGYYYYKIFNEKFNKLKRPINYYWMPKWQDKSLRDPSGRKIDAFNT